MNSKVDCIVIIEKKGDSINIEFRFNVAACYCFNWSSVNGFI